MIDVTKTDKAAPCSECGLVEMVAELSQALKAATLDEMGGTPDLFRPTGGWEKWDQWATDLLARAAKGLTEQGSEP
jgi:hypothetical protein